MKRHGREAITPLPSALHEPGNIQRPTANGVSPGALRPRLPIPLLLSRGEGDGASGMRGFWGSMRATGCGEISPPLRGGEGDGFARGI